MTVERDLGPGYNAAPRCHYREQGEGADETFRGWRRLKLSGCSKLTETRFPQNLKRMLEQGRLQASAIREVPNGGEHAYA